MEGPCAKVGMAGSGTLAPNVERNVKGPVKELLNGLKTVDK